MRPYKRYDAYASRAAYRRQGEKKQDEAEKDGDAEHLQRTLSLHYNNSHVRAMVRWTMYTKEQKDARIEPQPMP